MKHVRKLTAPLSAVFLILVAGFAFTRLQARTEYPPPILDPEFNLWASDPEFGGKKPMVWELEYVGSAGDRVLLKETVIADRKALEIQIFQDGADENLTYVRLGQTIDGARARALFDENIGIWVILQSSCDCKGPVSDQTVTFGIETNDGTHTLSLLFVETTAEMSISPTHRTIFLKTPMGEWTHHPIDLLEQYEDAQWKLPDRISLSIVFGVPGPASDWYAVFVYGFSVTKKTTLNPTRQNEMLPSSLSTTGPSILRVTCQSSMPSREAYSHKIGSPCRSNTRMSQGFNR